MPTMNALLFSYIFLWLSLAETQQNEPDQPFILVESLPLCEDNEFVTYNGTQLICQTLPVRECNCPVLLPQPPRGCQRFAPPDGGGFVCLNSEDTIYCSVQCDNTTEFSATPINPYRCGPATRFLWMDFTEEIYKELPQCDGFRHSRRPIFPESYYLPAPCNHLTDVQENEKFRDLLIELQFIYGCSDCSIAQAYVKCPPAFAT